jgi:hypothetical protein
MSHEELVQSLKAADATAAQNRQALLPSVARLMRIAMGDTGQCRRVADFLLAWHNAKENGGWDPTDLWNVDATIADDILTALRLLRMESRYPGDLGFQREIDRIWELWRARQPQRNDRSKSRG